MKKAFNFLSILLSIILIGCKNEKKSFSDIFQNKIWYVDSTVFDSISTYPGEVLKPVHDSVFDIYKDQTITFEKFKIKGDTLILKKFNNWKKFTFKQTQERNIIFQSLDSSETHYLQNLTNLFNGKNSTENRESKLFNELNNYTWYLIKVENLVQGEKLNDPEPTHYFKKNAFYIPDSLENKPYNNWFQKGFSYKFSDKAFYVYDNNKKVLIAAMFLIKDDMNQIKLFDVENWSVFTLKKIDYSILK